MPSTLPTSFSNPLSSFDEAGHPHDSSGTVSIELDNDSRDLVSAEKDDARLHADTPFGMLQLHIRFIIEHLYARIIGIILIIFDITLVAIDLGLGEDHEGRLAIDLLSLLIVTYFVVEVSLRILSIGSLFFYRWYEVFDLTVVVVSLATTLAFMYLDTVSGLAKLLVLLRLVRLVRVFRVFNERQRLETSARHTVGENKRRFMKDGFDLDLCYVTDRVIAMSFPSEGIMSLYRNPIKEVAKFMNQYHNGHYKVFNLCSERGYQHHHFGNRVERVFIDDHNVPKLKELVKFAADVRRYMDEDSKNVIAIHCRGGKGRTGTMVCVWLLEDNVCKNYEEALEYFGTRRTDTTVGDKFQGVETPSQVRYVSYFDIIKHRYNNQLPLERKLKFKSFKIRSIRAVGNGDGSDLSLKCFVGVKNMDTDSIENKEVMQCHFGSEFNCKVTHNAEEDWVLAEVTESPVLKDDVKVMFQSSNKNVKPAYDHCAFFFWFHTSFIEERRLIMERSEIDNPHKAKTFTTFTEQFAIEILFVDAD